jgi:hypothetical protein
MAKTMSQNTRNEYLERMRERYQRRPGKAWRSALLDEFCAVTGHERKYANKLLRRRRGPGRAGEKKRGAGKTYGEEVISVLFEIWKHAEQPCGKRLVPMLRDWLPFYEKHYGKLDSDTRSSVLAISAAQIDRLLAAKKVGVALRKRRTPKANAALKKLIPIRAESWDATEPGWTEADTVAHCGGDMGESFIWSLTVTGIYSGWTEVRSSWNRGQHSVCKAFEAIEAQLPFELLGVDTDNGGEFLNHHLHRHFTGRERPVEMTRSRPYRKNDQAHVEQKNSTHVRGLLGHGRLGHEPLMKPVFELLEAWSVWRNHFTSSFKQIENRREGSRTIRRHEKEPQTPCQRLIDYCRAIGDEATADSLERQRATIDPFELKAWIEKKLAQIWRLDSALNAAEAEGETDMGAVAGPILRRSLRSAPFTPQNRRQSTEDHPKPKSPEQKTTRTTKSSKAA